MKNLSLKEMNMFINTCIRATINSNTMISNAMKSLMIRVSK